MRSHNVQGSPSDEKNWANGEFPIHRHVPAGSGLVVFTTRLPLAPGSSPVSNKMPTNLKLLPAVVFPAVKGEVNPVWIKKAYVPTAPAEALAVAFKTLVVVICPLAAASA